MCLWWPWWWWSRTILFLLLWKTCWNFMGRSWLCKIYAINFFMSCHVISSATIKRIPSHNVELNVPILWEWSRSVVCKLYSFNIFGTMQHLLHHHHHHHHRNDYDQQFEMGFARLDESDFYVMTCAFIFSHCFVFIVEVKWPNGSSMEMCQQLLRKIEGFESRSGVLSVPSGSIWFKENCFGRYFWVGKRIWGKFVFSFSF